ncbi:hypothetical protein KI688_009657 [Linnemannia hyalina]|uniref:Uncharacterized protein n=1 Tax=Linnemannia hyalina TaxID=64524 RepID=A0A9P7XZP8_9FUNG|nr:hypothetical protein KI688_009657 [Linnemannia hyalina]
MALLTYVGFHYNESIPYDLNLLAHRALAIDFISEMKVDRPDVIDFLLQEIHPKQSMTQEQTPTQEHSTTQIQFHHYIPRFILKTFADNFSLSNNEFTTDTSNPNLSWFKTRNPSKPRRKVRPRHDINIYRVEDHTTNPIDVSRAYGAEDMYRDVTEADCMKFEKLLAKHESTSATFIRQIWNEDGDLSLTRTQLGDMKKFLCVMMYRSEYRRSHYFNQRFDLLFEMSVKRHMDHNKLSNAQTVWFENLKWIIEAPVEDIVEEYRKSIVARVESETPTALLSPYQGPIHAAELEDFGYLMTQTITCIWQAETGSEFILSEACFGAWEGDTGIWFHNFFVVSPRFAIVLVNPLYMAEKNKQKPRWTSMFEGKLHVIPETIYKKGPWSKDVDLATHSSPDDLFKYKRIVVPKEDVYKVNAILLDDRRQFLTYKSNVSMYKSLRYYDKVKKEMFHDCHDYSILQHKLFSDLNRTHPVDQ